MGLRGATYRWSSMMAHGNRLQESFRRPPEHRLDQSEEGDLFGLFVNAVATLECLGYTSFALGSIRHREAFLFEEERQRRNVTLRATARTFAEVYPGNRLTTALTRAAASRTYAQLLDARNHLSHRAAIPRMVEITESSRKVTWSLAAEWSDDDDVELTPEYVQNIQRLTAAHVFRIACGIHDFTGIYFVPLPDEE